MKMRRPAHVINPNEDRIGWFADRYSVVIAFHYWAVVISKVYATAHRKARTLGKVFGDANVGFGVPEN